jgi:phage tail-like protein
MGDSFENVSFKVKWDGRYISGISKVSALVRSTEVVQIREGGGTTTIKSPGVTSFDDITLERGRTSDLAFEEWANLVPGVPFAGTTTPSPAFRKDITIDVFNASGQRVLSYKVFQCWPRRYQALSVLDANNCADLIEQLTLEHNGWERDVAIIPPPPTP